MADEPTGNLDSLMARQVMDLLEKINEMGTTIIMVTHDPELARRAHRNVQVVDGQITDFKPYEAHGAPRRRRPPRPRPPSRSLRCSPTTCALALASFKRNPGLTALMVLAIALGIAVCMITLTSYRAAANNPAGERSAASCSRLRSTAGTRIAAYDDGRQDRWRPTHAHLSRRHGAATPRTIPDRKVIMYKSGGIYSRADKGMDPQYFATRMTTADFFAMFEVPFLYGNPWDAKADDGPEPVVVLSKEANQKAFGGVDSVGKTLRWQKREFRVIGVLDDWEPMPKYFDVSNGSFQDLEGAYVPFAWGPILELGSHGNTNCWKTETIDSFEAFLNSECIWFAAWVELRTADKQRAYREFLDNYVHDQKKHGRFPRPLNNYLYDVDGWLEAQQGGRGRQQGHAHRWPSRSWRCAW